MTARLPIPESAEALTVDWIRRALSLGGATDLPAPMEIGVVDIGAGQGSLGKVVRCTLKYPDNAENAPASVVVKLSRSDRKSLRIARTLSMYKREHACFSQLAPHMRIGIPGLLYGDFDGNSHRFVLVLEDLHAMERADQLAGAEAARARRVLRGAAELHGQFWGRLDRSPLSDFFAIVGPQKVWLSQLIYLACLVPCLERFGGLFSSRMRDLAEAFGARVADHLRGLATGPQTLTHGDFRLENMFFGEGGADDFTVIDWQTAGLIGDGLYDVAYFMAGSVPTEVRREIEHDVLREYHSVLCEMGVKGFAFEECWRRYRRNMLGMLLPGVCACGSLELGDERIRALCTTMLRRTLAAIEDLDAAEFMPAGSGAPRAASFLAFMSSAAYRTYGFAYRLFRPGTRAARSDED